VDGGNEKQHMQHKIGIDDQNASFMTNFVDLFVTHANRMEVQRLCATFSLIPWVGK